MGRIMLVSVAVLVLLIALVERGRRASWRAQPLQWKGTRVLVTGASGGLGQQMALDLCKAGASVVLVARRRQQLEQTRDACAGLGSSAEVYVVDMNNTQSIHQLAHDVQGSFDVLLLNHGVGGAKRFEHLSELDFARSEDMFRINVNSYARLVHLFLDRVRAGGSFAAVGSMAGVVPALYRSVYSPSKFALRALWSCLRLEMHERDLHWTLALPGYVLTDMHDHVRFCLMCCLFDLSFFQIGFYRQNEKKEPRIVDVRSEKDGGWFLLIFLLQEQGGSEQEDIVRYRARRQRNSS